MKKYLALTGAAVLIMALAMPAAAQMLTRSWGHIEFQTVYESKGDFNTGAQTLRSSSSTAVDQNLTYKVMYERFRLFLQHGDPKTVRAVVGFEGDSSDWGEASSGTVTGGKMGTYQADQTQLEIKWAFLEFVIPNTPVTMTVGIQPYQLGKGRPLVIANDAPGVTITGKFAPHEIQLGFWRENDDSRITYNIRENYFVQYALAQKDFNFYGFANYLNQNRDTATSRVHDNPYWLGVGGGGKAGNLNLSGQFIYVGGNREDFTSTKQKWDYEAFAAEALGEFQIGPGLSAGAEFFYATGNDANSGSTKIKMYPVATNSEARSGFGNDRTVFFWMASGVIGYQHNIQSDYGGFWYGRLFATYSPCKWLQVIFNYMNINDTATGSPANATSTNRINTPVGATQVKDESFVGHEINAITKINIYKGLGYHIGLAYFLPGDMYAAYNSAGSKTKSPDGAWAFNTRLRYDF